MLLNLLKRQDDIISAMSLTPRKFTKKEQDQLNQRLAPVYRKIGGLTFSVGLIALILGLWIDRVKKSQPIFTLALVVVSVPIVLWVNTRMLKREIAKAAEEIKNKQSDK